MNRPRRRSAGAGRLLLTPAATKRTIRQRRVRRPANPPSRGESTRRNASAWSPRNAGQPDGGGVSRRRAHLRGAGRPGRGTLRPPGHPRPDGYDIAGQVGIASTNAYAVVGWDDTRNSDEGSKANIVPGCGLQDIYIAAAQFEAIGGGTPSTAKVVLAGVVGVVVGLMLMLAAVVTKRRTGAASPTAGDSTKVDSKVGN